MAYYQGYMCDGCGKPMSKDVRTKVTVRYEGPKVSGESVQELCDKCFEPPENVEGLRPLRKVKASRKGAENAQEGARNPQTV